MELTRLEQIVAGADLTPLTRKEASLKKAIKRGIEEPKSGGSGGGVLVVGTSVDVQNATITLDKTADEIKTAIQNDMMVIGYYESPDQPGVLSTMLLSIYAVEQESIMFEFTILAMSEEVSFVAATTSDYPVASIDG